MQASENQEQPLHPIYHYAFITDAEEGLILTNVDTLTDGEPRNNFLNRALTWNPERRPQRRAPPHDRRHHFYIAADAGVVVLDMNDPLKPRVRGGHPARRTRARRCSSAICSSPTRAGWTSSTSPIPTQPVVVEGAHRAAGRCAPASMSRAPTPMSPTAADGLVIVDVEQPEHPKLYQKFTADGKINDAARRGRRLDQRLAVRLCRRRQERPEGDPAHLARPASPISTASRPPPKPELIAWDRRPSPALALSGPRARPRASTRPATRSRSSAASARARSTSRKCGGCIWTRTASPGSSTIRAKTSACCRRRATRGSDTERGTQRKPVSVDNRSGLIERCFFARHNVG